MKKIFLIQIVIFGTMGCFNSHEKNHLGNEKSPYLQQHAENPIWWYPWSNEAFDVAKEQDKMIFLSIGYSTCHWCHVMEEESFEDKEVAQVLNDHYVSIKVDREERPDVDAIYMEAVMALNRTGGWPMTIVMTPDRKPFFGATYIPKSNLIGLLKELSTAWKSDRSKMITQGDKLTQWLQNSSQETYTGELDEKLLKQFFYDFKKNYDTKYGSHIGQPKFPPGYALRLLLRIHRRSGNAEALKMVTHTLDQMAEGGIYDHLMGGFHRYSVDEKWLVPHFEKMLYDQASLAKAYLEAYELTNKNEYRLIVEEILNYVLREMTHSEGGFFTAQDADSEGGEGRFAVWKYEEIKNALSPSAFQEFIQFYPVTETGNFENGFNILTLTKSRAQRTSTLNETLKILQGLRTKRPQPLKDEKVITAWNGLMISTMAHAGRALGSDHYKKAASRACEFILNFNQKEGQFIRRWIDGEAKFAATLQDYAFMIDAFIETYRATYNERWLEEAKRMQQMQDKLFGHPEGGYYTTTNKDKTLLVRRQNHVDNVKPAGQSMAAFNLLRLSDYYHDDKMKAQVKKIFKDTPKYIEKYTSGFPLLLMALDYALDKSKEVALAGAPADKETQSLLQAIEQGFHPNMVVAVGKDSALPLLKDKLLQKDKPTAYVCENKVCRLPTSDPKKAAKEAHSFKALSL